VNQIKPEGLLIRKHGLKRLDEAMIRRQLSYQLHGTEADGHHAPPDVFAENITVSNGQYHFDACIAGQTITNISMPATGWHNLENMLAAITVAKTLKIDDEKIKAAVADYKGVKRRFEYWYNGVNAKGEQLVMIDDYAHHPEELRALLTGARALFPDLHCTIVFQPHLFSRTRDHAKAFGEVLSMADDAILLPIYPARELPMEGVNSELIAGYMPADKVKVLDKQAWISGLNNYTAGLYITAGAGDIDTLLPEVLKRLTN
jgi:UDP-N-acetylmuramate--alanine ligase